MITPVPGEMWQEADNCAIVYMGHDRWMAFGVEEPFTLASAPSGAISLPLRRLLTVDGEIAPERLLTPEQAVVRLQEIEEQLR